MGHEASNYIMSNTNLVPPSMNAGYKAGKMLTYVKNMSARVSMLYLYLDGNVHTAYINNYETSSTFQNYLGMQSDVSWLASLITLFMTVCYLSVQII